MKEYIVPLSEEEAFYGYKDMTTELIRCKDCKYKNKYGYCTLYLNFHHLTADMDYCSDAERKEE